MRPLHATTTFEPAVLARQMLKLERRGRYEEALSLISDDWPEPGFEPDVNDLAPYDTALLLLRFGSLVGFQGHNERIVGSQERSRDLLTGARDRFLDLCDTEMVAACENYLALAYWRTGEFKEADSFLDEALTRDLPSSSDSRLYSHIIRSLVLLSCRDHEQNIDYCHSVEADVRQFGNAFFNGLLYGNLGISLKDLHRIPEALSYLNLARAFHKRARHQIYVATVDNNLALLYKQESRFKLAHESVDSAIGIYKRLKDKTRQGSSLETKAQIFLSEGKFEQALVTIDASIALLRKSENFAYLAESLMMRSKIFLFLDNFTDAVLSLVEAVDLTRQRSGESVAKLLIDEFESALAESGRPVFRQITAEAADVELIVPPQIAVYSKYRGVWINNSYLESVGLPSGSLAVTAADKIVRGDLVAIMEKATGEVICGFYDAEFGIVCLELPAGEPQLFNDDDITVLGKIVGVCRNGKNAEGKMVVEPISL